MFSTMFWYETAIQGMFMGLGFWLLQTLATTLTTVIKKAWRTVFIPTYSFGNSEPALTGITPKNGFGPYTGSKSTKRTPRTNDDYSAWQKERAKN